MGNLIQIPLLSPVTFARVKTFDHIDNWADVDNTLFNADNFSDVDILPTPYHLNWIKDKELKFQIRQKGTVTVSIYNCATGAVTGTIVGSNVTPTYFVSTFDVYNYAWTTGTNGVWKILIHAVQAGVHEYYESDAIVVSTDLPECIYINYYHTSNDFGIVFSIDGTAISFDGRIYLESNMTNQKPGNTLDVLTSDRGETEYLQATPRRLFDIKFLPLPRKIVEMLNLIFSCDTIEINGIGVQPEGVMSDEIIEGTLASVASITVQQKDWDYNQNDTDTSISLITDDEDDFIANDTNVIPTI